jgi:hypothetical protein
MGDTITIAGWNYGFNSTKVTVTIDGIPCTTVDITEVGHRIQCTAPVGVSYGKTLLLEVDGQSVTHTFDYHGTKTFCESFLLSLFGL